MIAVNKDLIFNSLKNSSFNSVMSDAEINFLISNSKIITFESKRNIFLENDLSNSMYIIISGSVKIYHSKFLRETIISNLETGSHFGEYGLINNLPRTASAKSETKVELLQITKETFDELINNIKPDLKKYFDNYLSSISLRNFLKNLKSEDDTYDNKLITDFLNCLERVTFEKDQTVIKYNDLGDAFYIVDSGQLKVTDYKNKILKNLNKGDFFGEVALILETPRTANVITINECILYKLNKKNFQKLIKNNKALYDKLYSYIKQYHIDPELIKKYSSLYNAESFTGETSYELDFEVKEKSLIDHIEFSRKFYKIFKNYPSALQNDATDCGAACLHIILKYYKKNISIGYLRDLANVSKDGSNISSILKAARLLGLDGSGVKTNYDGLNNVNMPSIAHWQGYHWIVIFEKNPEYVIVSDPAIGRRKILKDDFIEGWTGIIIEIFKTPKLDGLKSHKTSIQRFSPYFTNNKKILFEIFIASVIISVLGMISPIFTQALIDNVLINKNYSILNLMLIGMISLSIFSSIIDVLRNMLVTYLSMKIDAEMILNFYSHILSLPTKYFENRRAGDTISKFAENTKIRHFLTSQSIGTLLNIIMLFTYFTFMSYFSPKLTLMVFPSIFILVLSTYIISPILRKKDNDIYLKSGDYSSFMIESVTAIQSIKQVAGELKNRWKWEDLFNSLSNKEYEGSLLGLNFNSATSFINLIISTVFFYYASTLVMSYEITIGQMLAFNGILGSFMGAFMGIIHTWDSFQSVIVSINRLNDVFDSKPEEPDDKALMPPIKGNIVFENVSFTYGNKKPVIKNINLVVEAGQMVAIVGKSGCGKTTLMKLLLKVYPITEGSIKIDGYDINDVSAMSIRKQAGIVMQDSFLFSGTIRNNITCDNQSISSETLEKVIKISGVDLFLSKLEKGSDTMLIEKGKNISGGQRQRVSIARALINNPRILIFDEATSALDTESEKIIQENIKYIVKNRTSFVIAHRLSTIRNADKIIVMDKGEIVEIGDHDTLMNNQGLYYYLNSQQL